MKKEKSAPCGGCPPCCNGCTWSPAGLGATKIETVVVPAAAYGCVRPDGGDVVIAQGPDGATLGQMRRGSFHPVTPEGASFLRRSGNALAAFLSPAGDARVAHF